jgi:hypothetical protein
MIFDYQDGLAGSTDGWQARERESYNSKNG